MKKFSAVITSVWFASMLCVGAIAQQHSNVSATIVWNKDGDATLGPVEPQLAKNVVDPIKATMAHGRDYALTITVEGYTSTTGTPEANSQVSAWRADNVRQFLAREFPNAKIYPLPMGTAPNAKQARQVTVLATISTLPLATPAREHRTPVGAIVAIAGGSILAIVLIAAFAPRTTRKPKTAEVDEAVEAVEQPVQPTIENPVIRQRIIKNVLRPSTGKRYYIPAIYRQDPGDAVPKWHSPLKGRNSSRVEWNDLVGAAKSEFKQISDADLQDLLDRHQITEVRM